MRRGVLVTLTAALASGVATAFLGLPPQSSVGLKATTTLPPALPLFSDADVYRPSPSSFGSNARTQLWMSKVTTDEDIMEELIGCPWDNLDELASKYYRVLSQPSFYMKFADRIYKLPTEQEQNLAADKATKVWNVILKVMEAAETQMADAAELVKAILSSAAEKDGEFYLPLSKDRVDALRSEVIKNLDKLDEAFLTTLNGWMTKVQDDEQNAAMTQVFQKIYQHYSGQMLMRCKDYDRPSGTTPGPALVFLRCLFNADPDEWDMLLYQGLKQDVVCSYEQFIEEIGAMIQGVVLKHVEGSMTQRVQAEYLRELMSRAQRYQSDSGL